MNGMRNRVVVLVLAIAVIAGLLACGTEGLISRTEPTATPTKTPKPTFTVTLTPTDTPIPTDTPTPTNTATPTPEATNTPIVLTATFTPEPTFTPVPTATPVPPTSPPRPRPTATRPRPTPTKPKPANTPAPQYEFRKVSQVNWPNCGSTGVKVYFKQRNGSIYPGVQFALYAGGCVGVSNRANQSDGSTDFLIWPNGVRPGSWEIQAVEVTDGTIGEAGCGKITQLKSERIPFQTTDKPCEPGTSGVQWVHITLQEN